MACQLPSRSVCIKLGIYWLTCVMEAGSNQSSRQAQVQKIATEQRLTIWTLPTKPRCLLHAQQVSRKRYREETHSLSPIRPLDVIVQAYSVSHRTIWIPKLETPTTVVTARPT